MTDVRLVALHTTDSRECCNALISHHRGEVKVTCPHGRDFVVVAMQPRKVQYRVREITRREVKNDDS